MSHKESKEELGTTVKIYKIAGIIIAVLILFGIGYSIMTREKAPEPTPEAIPQPIPEAVPEPTPEVTPEPTPEPTPEAVPEPTPEANITNETINATPMPEPKPQVSNYTWEGITIEFPDTMKRIDAGKTTHHYIIITEPDGTPITNGEQFDLKFTTKQPYSMDSELIPSFEGGKWLVTLRLTNKGTAGLTVKITCENKAGGYCQRLYPEGGIEKSTTIEIV